MPGDESLEVIGSQYISQYIGKLESTAVHK